MTETTSMKHDSMLHFNFTVANIHFTRKLQIVKRRENRMNRTYFSIKCLIFLLAFPLASITWLSSRIRADCLIFCFNASERLSSLAIFSNSFRFLCHLANTASLTVSFLDVVYSGVTFTFISNCVFNNSFRIYL
ncbi:hypothetical protein EMN47_14215 [Prolixibacteraceae bacterium JC049]|nr:hypothetical protein [Prolixibacteraceae bacterium JC049]